MGIVSLAPLAFTIFLPNTAGEINYLTWCYEHILLSLNCCVSLLSRPFSIYLHSVYYLLVPLSIDTLTPASKVHRIRASVVLTLHFEIRLCVASFLFSRNFCPVSLFSIKSFLWCDACTKNLDRIRAPNYLITNNNVLFSSLSIAIDSVSFCIEAEPVFLFKVCKTWNNEVLVHSCTFWCKW